MIAGVPSEARWVRSAPRRDLPAPLLEQIVQSAFPGCRVVHAQPLTSGLRNSNFKLQLSFTNEPLVLRIYEHDLSLCRKEIDLFALVGKSVPVPEVMHAAPEGIEDFPPFTLTRFTDGVTFHQLKASGDLDSIAAATCSVGETLAAIGRFTFPKPGWIGPGPTVMQPLLEGADAIPRFADNCLASSTLRQRTSLALREQLHALLWASSAQLEELAKETQLVHGDFNRRNLLLTPSSDGAWRVAAVLDWEFAVSGSPLGDIRSFLRYENDLRPLAEPHFSIGYLRAGGKLPEEWRRLARLVDVISICESLTHPDLPPDVTIELIGLLEARVPVIT